MMNDGGNTAAMQSCRNGQLIQLTTMFVMQNKLDATVQSSCQEAVYVLSETFCRLICFSRVVAIGALLAA